MTKTKKYTRKSARKTTIVGFVGLLATPLFYFIIAALTVMDCPKTSSGECEMGYAITSSMNVMGVTIIWAVISLVLMGVGGYKLLALKYKS